MPGPPARPAQPSALHRCRRPRSGTARQSPRSGKKAALGPLAALRGVSPSAGAGSAAGEQGSARHQDVGAVGLDDGKKRAAYFSYLRSPMPYTSIILHTAARAGTYRPAIYHQRQHRAAVPRSARSQGAACAARQRVQAPAPVRLSMMLRFWGFGAVRSGSCRGGSPQGPAHPPSAG